MREHSSGTFYLDFAVAYGHLCHDEPGVRLPKLRGAVEQLVTQQRTQSVDLVWRNRWLASRDPHLSVGNVRGGFVSSQLQANQPLAHAWIVCVHKSLFDEPKQSGDRGFDFLLILSHARYAIAVLIGSIAVEPQLGIEKCLQPVGLEYLFHDFINDDAVEPVHPDPQTVTGHCFLLQLAGATIVSVHRISIERFGVPSADAFDRPDDTSPVALVI